AIFSEGLSPKTALFSPWLLPLAIPGWQSLLPRQTVLKKSLPSPQFSCTSFSVQSYRSVTSIGPSARKQEPYRTRSMSKLEKRGTYGIGRNQKDHQTTIL